MKENRRDLVSQNTEGFQKGESVVFAISHSRKGEEMLRCLMVLVCFSL